MYRKIGHNARDNDQYSSSSSSADSASTSSAEEVVELGTAKANGGFEENEKPPLQDDKVPIEKEIEVSDRKHEPKMRRHLGWGKSVDPVMLSTKAIIS